MPISAGWPGVTSGDSGMRQATSLGRVNSRLQRDEQPSALIRLDFRVDGVVAELARVRDLACLTKCCHFGDTRILSRHSALVRVARTSDDAAACFSAFRFGESAAG